MQKILCNIGGLLLWVVLGAGHAGAYELTPNISGYATVNLLSDYRSNGISSSLGDPAAQLDVGWMHSSGLIASLWMSNVNFGTKTRVEEGGSFGIYKEAGDFSVTATIGRYIYPKDADFSLNEFYGAITWKDFKYQFIYDFDQVVPNGKFQYLGYTFSLPYESSLYVEYGYHNIGNLLYSGSGHLRDTYSTKKVSLKRTVSGIDLSASYIDTDISASECTNYTGFDDLCSATVVFGASKTF